MYKYINQKDPANDFVYAVHPVWSAPDHPMHFMKDMTISKMGCGLCSATMIVQNLAGKDVSLKEIADLAVSWGYHTSGKFCCDMKVLAPVLAEVYSLDLKMTNDGAELLDWLNNGGMAIAHSRGDSKEEGYTGVVSHGRHYVVVAKAEGRTLTVLDPSLVPGKYDEDALKDLVTVNGNEIYLDVDVMVKDCKYNLPYFYMFARKVSVKANGDLR